jgi:hypothetical protein
MADKVTYLAHEYRGYFIMKHVFDLTWAAYCGGNTQAAWFRGKTAEDVRAEIDEAYACIPEPVV